MPKIQNKSVLVTGGAGFIGSHLVDYLVKQNVKNIVVLDNFLIGNRKNLDDACDAFKAIEVIDLDVSDFNSLSKFVKGKYFDVIFDLATIQLLASLERPHWAAKTIFDLGANICEIARLGHAKTVVHVSSSEAYGSAKYAPMDEKHPLIPETTYAAAKAGVSLLFEAYHRTFNLDMTIIRPFNNYGPRQNMKLMGIVPKVIKLISEGITPTIYGDGLQTRDFLFVRDTVRGLVMAYENETTRGKTLNLASGKELAIKKVINDISNLMSWKKEPIYGPERPGDVRRHCADVTLATSLIGFEQEVEWNVGLKETVEWYLQNSD